MADAGHHHVANAVPVDMLRPDSQWLADVDQSLSRPCLAYSSAACDLAFSWRNSMTPLACLYSRFLPAFGVRLALVLSYALGIMSLWLVDNSSAIDIVYIDLETSP